MFGNRCRGSEEACSGVQIAAAPQHDLSTGGDDQTAFAEPIQRINRDFPYQVALSFDEIAMEVLAWLEDRSFEWDMYVDLRGALDHYAPTGLVGDASEHCVGSKTQ